MPEGEDRNRPLDPVSMVVTPINLAPDRLLEPELSEKEVILVPGTIDWSVFAAERHSKFATIARVAKN